MKITDLPCEIIYTILNFLNDKEDAINFTNCFTKNIIEFLYNNHPFLLFIKIKRDIKKLMKNSIELQNGSKFTTQNNNIVKKNTQNNENLQKLNSFNCIKQIVKELTNEITICNQTIKAYKKQQKMFTIWSNYLNKISNKNWSTLLSEKLFKKIQYLQFTKVKTKMEDFTQNYKTCQLKITTDISFKIILNENPYNFYFQIYWIEKQFDLFINYFGKYKKDGGKEKYLKEIKEKLDLMEIEDNLLVLWSLVYVMPFDEIYLEDLTYCELRVLE